MRLSDKSFYCSHNGRLYFINHYYGVNNKVLERVGGSGMEKVALAVSAVSVRGEMPLTAPSYMHGLKRNAHLLALI